MIIEVENKKDYVLIALYHIVHAALVIAVFVSTGIATHKFIVVPKAKVQAVRELVAR